MRSLTLEQQEAVAARGDVLVVAGAGSGKTSTLIERCVAWLVDEANQAGADEIILYTQQDFEVETKKLTTDKGVDVVYDSVGKTTFEKGLNVLRPRGMMVLYGGSSGAAPALDPIVLTQKGSLFLTRPSLGNYIATDQELKARSQALFDMVSSGKLKLRIEHTYPLAEAQRAHRDLEGRKTTGKLLLIP